MNEHFHRIRNKKNLSLILWLILFISSFLVNSAYGAENLKIGSDESILVTVNLQRILGEMNLVQASLSKGDNSGAFEHAYIPHSTILPSINDKLREIDQNSTEKLESDLTDLPILVKSNADSSLITNKITLIVNTINGINSFILTPNSTDYNLILISTITILLNDASKHYQLSNVDNSNSTFNQIHYENAIELVNISHKLYNNISKSFSDSKQLELVSSFDELKNSLDQKSDLQNISQLITAIHSNMVEDETNFQSNQSYENYFANIKYLLSNTLRSVMNDSDYSSADKYAITAYLDNFEYLETPIEKLDPELKSSLETMMREELRDLIKNKEQSQTIQVLITDISTKLEQAANLFNINYENIDVNDIDNYDLQVRRNVQIKNLTDINELSKGFSTYTGIKKGIGESSDSDKTGVRTNIDQIRIKLVDLLQQYEEGEYDEAYVISRSAYLDSYENIEIPLRPIDPDFTLDMEIKFAELRNLIQQHQSYKQIESKVSEIREGLDESERLVSGTGIIAPTLAFSTSFSIIFREGLESALIIGAIITYLEASRNGHYKKHVYLGILIAIIGTIITWFVAQFVIDLSGASRELIEAIAGISAVVVLFWISFWILNKIETKKWIEFVKAKVWQATTSGSIMVFAMLSFFTVYREGFETVLFYQAMLSFAKNMEFYVILGLLLGLAVIISIVFIIKKLGKKLPLRVLFALTMAIGAYMSIAFIGNAVREFQEVGYISTTHLFGIIPRLEINLATMTGIHPTLETTIAQIILLSIYVVGSLYVLFIRPRKKKMIESSRKSMAELKGDKT